ncbi:MAG: hypothetical protein EOM24_35830, partial [Chloroflexia bacterium]|nr:hypothetical protein [Chloroflexia bacterium]
LLPQREREAQALDHLIEALAHPRYADGVRKLLTHLAYTPEGRRALGVALAQRQRQHPEAPLPPALAFLAVGFLTSATGAGVALVAYHFLRAAVKPPPPGRDPEPASDTARPGDAARWDPTMIPVSTAAWRTEIQRRTTVFGAPEGYFCVVRAGTYRIGGWEPSAASAKLAVPAFWMARVPITVAQFAAFIKAGGYRTPDWWTRAGWQWRQLYKRTEPYRWDEPGYRDPTQPVVGVMWYEAQAYCTWLTAALRSSLPDGMAVRLPTEAEWEVAAAYDADGRRHPFPWGEAPLTPERAVYGGDAHGHAHPARVGSCPTGAAACGALDLVGNVWELTTTVYDAYPAQANSGIERFTDQD